MADQDYRVSPFGLSRYEAAHFIGVCATTFDKLVAEGLMPAPKRVFTRKVWVRRDLERALIEMPDASETADKDASRWGNVEV